MTRVVLRVTVLAMLFLCGGRLFAACEGVAVQVLGSGGPEMGDKRASSAYLVWKNGRARALIDMGGGTALRFEEAGAKVNDLDAVLFTHYHVDHSVDFPALIKASFFTDRARDLPVFGPTGNDLMPSTTEFVQALFAQGRGAFRYLGNHLDRETKSPYKIKPNDVALENSQAREIFLEQGLKVSAAKVIHGPLPALAFRIEAAGKSVVISGGTNGEGGLEQLARGADVLIAHHAVPEGATGVERKLHMPPSRIGEIAAAAKVKKLVLSHRMLRTVGKEHESQTAIAANYKGPVVFADDLNCFALQ
ncbi:MAG: MBL fold metallo-hydrolase [Burkholderiales bacterium]